MGGGGSDFASGSSPGSIAVNSAKKRISRRSHGGFRVDPVRGFRVDFWGVSRRNFGVSRRFPGVPGGFFVDSRDFASTRLVGNYFAWAGSPEKGFRVDSRRGFSAVSGVGGGAGAAVCAGLRGGLGSGWLRCRGPAPMVAGGVRARAGDLPAGAITGIARSSRVHRVFVLRRPYRGRPCPGGQPAPQAAPHRRGLRHRAAPVAACRSRPQRAVRVLPFGRRRPGL